MSEIKRVGVAGAGTMGSGIAIVCARAGFETVNFDLQQAPLDQVAKRNARLRPLGLRDLQCRCIMSLDPAQTLARNVDIALLAAIVAHGYGAELQIEFDAKAPEDRIDPSQVEAESKATDVEAP